MKMSAGKTVLILGLFLAMTLSSVAVGQEPLDPGQARRLVNAARGLLEQGDLVAAAARLDSVLAHDPGAAQASHLRATICLAQADTTGALERLGRGLAEHPLYMGLALLQTRLDLAQGRMAAAADRARRILTLRPRQAEALYYLGLAGLATGDTNAALTAWDAALAAEVATEEMRP